MQYLLNASKEKSSAHLFTDGDTLCKMFSTGGMNKRKHQLFSSDMGKEICTMCSSVLRKQLNAEIAKEPLPPVQQRPTPSQLTRMANEILRSGRAHIPQARETGMHLVTVEWIKANATPAGGYKAEQVRLIGLRYPLQHGWMQNAAGRLITMESKRKFEAFHGGYKATKKSHSVMASLLPEDSAEPGSPRRAVSGDTYAITRSAPVQSCGCTDVLPWEDCEHTDAEADKYMREFIFA